MNIFNWVVSSLILKEIQRRSAEYVKGIKTKLNIKGKIISSPVTLEDLLKQKEFSQKKIEMNILNLKINKKEKVYKKMANYIVIIT